MGGGGDGGAAAARAQQQRTQALQDMWAQNVRNTFEGGTMTMYNPVAAGALYNPSNQYFTLTGAGKWQPDKGAAGAYSAVKPGATLDPNAQYYTRGGAYTPPASPKGGMPQSTFTYSPVTDKSSLGALEAAGKLYDRPVAGNNVYTSSTSTQPGYGPDFYNKVASDYVNYAMPQFNTQLGQAQTNLLGNMATRGLIGSSVAQQQADLLSAYANTQKQGIVDAGTQQSNALKQQMTTQENNLVNQVLASADPASAAAGALSTAASFSAPPALQPLGNLFQNYANAYLVNQASRPTASASPYSYYAPGFNPYTTQTGFLPSNG